MYAVQLINVSKIFKTANNAQEFTGVKEINLQIASGEFFSLLGSSGCGKTTTLRMIAGFEKPTSGEIYIDGQEMANRPPFQRPVNTVFQNYALFPHLSVAKNIAFGLEMEKMPKSTINTLVGEALEMVELVGLDKRYPPQLSGGQQQRVALARSLVKKPKVLLLDEPLGALDLKLRKQVQLELKQLQKQLGITFIYVTHDQEEALTMSDRLGVMDQGKLLQIGTPQEIYEYPTSSFVADFIGESNLLSGRVVEHKGTQIGVLVADTLQLYVTHEEKLDIGTGITLVLRPEKVGLHPFSYDDSSCLPGKIKQAVYLGNDTRYQVQITEQISLIIRHSNSALKPYQPEEQVKVKISPDSFRVLVEK